MSYVNSAVLKHILEKLRDAMLSNLSLSKDISLAAQVSADNAASSATLSSILASQADNSASAAREAAFSATQSELNVINIADSINGLYNNTLEYANLAVNAAEQASDAEQHIQTNILLNARTYPFEASDSVIVTKNAAPLPLVAIKNLQTKPLKLYISNENMLPPLITGQYKLNGITTVVSADGAISLSGYIENTGYITRIPLSLPFLIPYGNNWTVYWQNAQISTKLIVSLENNECKWLRIRSSLKQRNAEGFEWSCPAGTEVDYFTIWNDLPRGTYIQLMLKPSIGAQPTEVIGEVQRFEISEETSMNLDNIILNPGINHIWANYESLSVIYRVDIESYIKSLIKEMNSL